jgi:hypothetical protein
MGIDPVLQLRKLVAQLRLGAVKRESLNQVYGGDDDVDIVELEALESRVF